MKILKKGIAVLLAALLVSMNFICAVYAAEKPSVSNPVKYAYEADIYVTNDTGDYISNKADIAVTYYLSKKAYDNGEDSIASCFAEYRGSGEGEGKYSAIYVGTFTKDPPASLYWVAFINGEPQYERNVHNIIAPMSGTAQAQRLD